MFQGAQGAQLDGQRGGLPGPAAGAQSAPLGDVKARRRLAAQRTPAAHTPTQLGAQPKYGQQAELEEHLGPEVCRERLEGSVDRRRGLEHPLGRSATRDFRAPG